MKPTGKQLQALCPQVDEQLIREHLSRLEERYFELFSQQEIAEHLQALSSLSPEQPLRILVHPQPQRGMTCTVLAFDYPGEFSLITGTLAALGFNILSGEVFTYAQYQENGGPSRARSAPFSSRLRKSRSIGADPLRRRRIIDHFSGTVSGSDTPEIWETRLRGRLSETVSLLERGDSRSQELARQRVNELVARYLATAQLPTEAVLYPVQVEEIRRPDGGVALRVIAQDTPFFLYALSTALALRSIFIESILIRTIDNRIEDEFSFLDSGGKRITEIAVLDQVKLSVLLTKQFTYFLASAPDPYAALYRFEQLVEAVLALPEQGRWSELLSNPLVLKELARLLGTSDLLWEDFIRLQYETLLPLLEPHLRGQSFSAPRESLAERLGAALAGEKTLEARRRALNEFKDREIFLLELDHILDPEADFRLLSEGLTRLAEAVVNEAVRLAADRLLERYGQPQTVAGLPARFCFLGLGKLGGGDLGYASDIELLFVYSDSGSTTGKEVIPNSEFFEFLVREAAGSIRTKKEGIFQIDLRLRPYGASGPMACSLETFCRYYGPGGDAHELEKLALVRLRAIGGDVELGEQVERLRDEMIYTGKPPSLEVLREARLRQMDERTRRGELNAKFSPGALLDLEYTVMLLQVAAGAREEQLRSPYIRQALGRLQQAGILEQEEAQRLSEAYEFLRRLINSLRMLRGSALDLFLPQGETDEFVHLARRMGYSPGAELSPARKLHLDFETHSAFVRAFVEKHFGRESLPVPGVGNVADLILSSSLSAQQRRTILERAGFRNAERAFTNLRNLARAGDSPISFARLAVLAADLLRSQPDADMALNNWERLAQVLDNPAEHFRLLLSQPKRLDILLSIFAGSQYLSDSLVRNPEFFEWATIPEHLHRVRGCPEVEALFRRLSGQVEQDAEGDRRWRNLLRVYKRREVLRIGIRDICLGVPIEEIMQELSALAEALLRVDLERIWTRSAAGDLSDRFCLLAFGKLGGGELNYSSDLDLLALTRDAPQAASEAVFQQVMERLREDFSAHTEEGALYRVDLRLRPFGRAGQLIGSVASISSYYQQQASLWEIQALLKARPVAGNIRIGEGLLQSLRELVREPRQARSVASSLASLRATAQAKARRGIGAGPNIKLGAGGIRDVEFLVQGLQLIQAGKGRGEERLLSGNTLTALGALREAGLLPAVEAEQLARDYLFLRRIEHYLQIFEDRQTHTLPRDPGQLEVLARRLLGADAGRQQFMERVKACLSRVEQAYQRHLGF